MLRQIRAQGGWVFKLESDSYVDLNILGTSWNLRVISKIYLTILFDLICMYSYEAGGQEAAVNQAWMRWPLHLPPKRPRCLVIALWQTYKIFQMVYLSCSIPPPNHSCQPPWIDSRSTRGCSVARGKIKSGHDETTLTQPQFISPCYLIVLIILYHHHSLSSSFFIIIILYHHHSLSSFFIIFIIFITIITIIIVIITIIIVIIIIIGTTATTVWSSVTLYNCYCYGCYYCIWPLLLSLLYYIYIYITKYYHHLQYILVHYCGKFETNAHIPRHIYIYIYICVCVCGVNYPNFEVMALGSPHYILSSTGLLLTQIPCGGDSMKR